MPWARCCRAVATTPCDERLLCPHLSGHAAFSCCKASCSIERGDERRRCGTPWRVVGDGRPRGLLYSEFQTAPQTFRILWNMRPFPRTKRTRRATYGRGVGPVSLFHSALRARHGAKTFPTMLPPWPLHASPSSHSHALNHERSGAVAAGAQSTSDVPKTSCAPTIGFSGELKSSSHLRAREVEAQFLQLPSHFLGLSEQA